MAKYYPKSMEAEIATGLKCDFRVRIAEQFLYRMLEGGVTFDAAKGVTAASLVGHAYDLAESFVHEGERREVLAPSVLTQEDMVENQIRLQVHANEFGSSYTALRGGGRAGGKRN